MDIQEVHCLKCDDVYTETDTFIEVCPFCGNDDTQLTVYLQKEKKILRNALRYDIKDQYPKY